MNKKASSVYFLSLGNHRTFLMTTKEIVTVDKDILGGIPVFKNTRVPIQNLFDYLEAGDSINTFLQDFEYIPREHCIFILKTSEKLLKNSMLNEDFNR